jgi:hypothetical protein
MSFDIVIPLGPNEWNRFQHQLEHTKTHVKGYRRIYLISYDRNIQVDGCITLHESVFPFMPFITSYFAAHKGKSSRNGWYFQQLIKLYAAEYIPELLDDYLVLDADVFFIQDVEFLTADGKAMYSHGDEYHIPYFDHMKRLHPSLTKYYASDVNKSGICHHMMFHRARLQELFHMVESYHVTITGNHRPFWQVFILSVLEHTKYENIRHPESGASEYELYFNYMLHYHPDKIVVRYMPWTNVSRNISSSGLDFYLRQGHYYVSICHWYG